MRRVRVFYAGGPGDIIGTYGRWKAGVREDREMAVPFSAQLFDACKELGLDVSVLAHRTPNADFEDHGIHIVHRPWILPYGRGVMFHVGLVASGLRILYHVLKERADIAVISSGTTHWFMCLPLHLLGVEVIAAVHNRVWAPQDDTKAALRLIRRLNAPMWQRMAGALVPSFDVAKQVRTVADDRPPPLVEYLPIYRAESFGPIPERDPKARPFRVIFVGRIEEIKGVFQLLEIAKRFRAKQVPVEFDLCGHGDAYDALVEQTNAAGLADVFRLHGHCNQDKLSGMLAAAHVMIAPSTHQVGEGLGMVLAEAAIAGLPAIISTSFPSEYFHGAVEIIEADDVDGFENAIVRLMTQPERYVELVRGTRRCRAQFLDASRGFGAGLHAVFTAILNGHKAESVSWVTSATPELASALPSGAPPA